MNKKINVTKLYEITKIFCMMLREARKLIKINLTNINMKEKKSSRNF